MHKVAVLASVLVLLAALPAAAHGTFVDARPLPGVTVGGVVDEVEFLFPEPLVETTADIAVVGPDGTRVPTTGPVESPTSSVIRVGIEPLTAAGRYRVDHVVTATDGFVFEGSFFFTYQPSATALDPLPYGRSVAMWIPLTGLVAFFAIAAVVVARTRRSGQGGQLTRR